MNAPLRDRLNNLAPAARRAAVERYKETCR